MGASGRICAERKRRQTGAPLRHRPYPHERDLIMNLEGKTAFITGGGGGIGKGMAQAFAERGMMIGLSEIDLARAAPSTSASMWAPMGRTSPDAHFRCLPAAGQVGSIDRM